MEPARYREINDWELYLVDNGIRVVKVMLNLSKREQAKRFLKRVDHPEKNWKFSSSDIKERGYWDEYQRAFEAMVSHTSTTWAPWYVVPSSTTSGPKCFYFGHRRGPGDGARRDPTPATRPRTPRTRTRWRRSPRSLRRSSAAGAELGGTARDALEPRWRACRLHSPYE